MEWIKRPLDRGRQIIRPTAIVIHYTAGGTLEGAYQTFAKGNLSAHFIIDRDGTTVQCLPLDQRGAHAGKSEWKGLSNFNNFSIGIELVNWGNLTADGRSWTGTVVGGNHYIDDNKVQAWQTYTCLQYLSCKRLLEAIKKLYPIKYILGHDDIAPGRKSDPGPAFLWDLVGGKKT